MTRLPCPGGVPIVALVAGACGAAGPGPGPAPTPADTGGTHCVLGGGAGATLPDTLSVGLSEPVDPGRAPVPTNAAEALVFRHLYESLIHVDCAGQPAPGLATAWTTPDGGRTWLFTLRPGAQFWDGAPVTAGDVLASWAGRRASPDFAAAAVGERVVRVTLREAAPVPTVLADPQLAVTKRTPDGGWPIGAGGWWVTSATAGAGAITASPVAPGFPVIGFRLLPGADLRDALDGGIDVLVTGDRATLDYAATLPEVPAFQLDWDRTYALAIPAGAGRPRAETLGGGTADTTLGRALRVEARAPAPPFWWLEVERCTRGEPTPAPPEPGGAGRIAYDRTDRPAGELAHRLVALAAVGRWPATSRPGPAPGRTVLVAAGLAPADFAAALRLGTQRAFVVALPRRVFDPCGAARALLPSYDVHLVPLVETRPRALVRRGLPGFEVDWDGTLHVLRR